MTVNCTAEIIEITAPYCAFYNEGIVSTAFRGEGDNCIIKNSGVNMEMSVPVNRECGTEVTTEENFIVYKNAIIGEYPPEEGTNFVGNFVLEFQFTCGFESDVDVMAGTSVVEPGRRRRNS